MSENFSSNTLTFTQKAGKVITLMAWTVVGFVLANAIVIALVDVLRVAGVPLGSLNKGILNFILAAGIYILSVAIIIGLPWLIKKRITTKEEIGVTRLPNWMDILLAPAGLIVYLIASSVIVLATQHFVPGLDLEQPQKTGFEGISQRYEYILAFIALIILAPVMEEVLFRGYLYGKLRKYVPIWLAILITSALFGLAHGQWNVAIDVFALSIVLCSLREVTGNIWTGVLLHMMKNSIAFYFLFINPSLLDTIGK